MDSIDSNKKHLKVLYLEDTLFDVQIIKEILPEVFELDLTHVDNEDDFVKALEQKNQFDIILSDYKLPAFSAPEALKIAKQKYPETPFICLSGTIGEERAVELLKQGATDYILKDRMGRLNTSIQRALKEAEEQKVLVETQKRLEEQNIELRKAKEKAEESDRLKSVFFNNISHEIRTPMNGILGFAELLNVKDDKETREQYIEIIKNSAKQLLGIINDIIEISVIDSKQLKIYKSFFDLDETFSYLFLIYDKECKAKNIELKKKEINPEYSSLYTDENKLKQILSNLISNAIKFSEEGKIEYGAAVNEKNEIQFYVKDTGIGIKPENHEIIFQRFRQVEEGYTRNYGGNGLGLAIVKSLVEELGGNIWVDSNMNKGSTFYFTIASAFYNKEDHKISPPTEEFSGDSFKYPDYSSFHFLIVEDERHNYLYMEEILSETGVQLIHAKNGQEAVDICKNKTPNFDLIIMDVQMPVMDGLAATKEIKLFSATPILALTAYASYIDRNKILESGCDGYLSKPVNRKTLFDNINKLVYQHQS